MIQPKNTPRNGVFFKDMVSFALYLSYVIYIFVIDTPLPWPFPFRSLV